MNIDKLHKRMDYLFKHEDDKYFLSIDLSKFISNRLLSYQYLHLCNLITAFHYHKIIMDGSDTGTGKTYTAIALCKHLNLKPLIICPKILISNWNTVCQYFQVEPYSIVNYETIKNGFHYNEAGYKEEANFLDISKESGKRFRWKIPHNVLVIFDEVHRCRNKSTINGQLLLSTLDQKVLLISATISDTPENFFIFGYMLKMYKNRKELNTLINESINNTIQTNNKSLLHDLIFPNKGSRMDIKELGDQFPSNQIGVNSYLIESSKIEVVNKAFREIDKNTLKLKSAGDSEEGKVILAEITKSRQIVEDIKLEIIKDLVMDYRENGFSIVIFVNYVESVKKLSKLLNVNCLAYGGLSKEEVSANIEKFQNNEEDIIICTFRTGGVGISLHDLYGKQRVSIISPSFSSTDLIQALGRIYRSGSVSPAIQRIIYCANTCEQVICNRLKEKINFLSSVNDSDLTIQFN